MELAVGYFIPTFVDIVERLRAVCVHTTDHSHLHYFDMKDTVEWRRHQGARFNLFTRNNTEAEVLPSQSTDAEQTITNKSKIIRFPDDF